jgi:glycine/D-amino acid oxidase-like deaminating enzyme/nitrite reductase/ring-hydroxylating ferredoxin subunit
VRRGVTDQTGSLWIETTEDTAFPPLSEPLHVDVAVVGAGICGITSALLLKRAGKSIALLDSKRILRGATGFTTAKVSVAHGLTYTTVMKNFGVDGARLYAQANQAGLDLIAELVDAEGIDCELERKDNYVYAETPDERRRVEHEVEAAAAAGLNAELVADLPLPYRVEGAFRLQNQAQFHPRKYLLPLARAVEGDGSRVLELTRVHDVKEGQRIRVITDRGELTARDLVLASHLPILDRGLYFAKAHPERSYAVAARITAGQDPDGMYINVGRPTRSLRTAGDEHGRLLLLGGEGHKPGTDPDTEARYRALEDFGREHWQVEEFPYRWSTQDYMPLDGVPYVGRLTRRSAHIYVATGFKKWGMTNGTAAAVLLADLIVGRKNAWAELYDAKRLTPRASATKFLKENGLVARHFVGDRLERGDELPLSAILPGQGRLVRVRGRKVAAYREEDGQLHTLSPVCTHLGCHVAWNTAEHSWDCPCHGSRFRGDGTLIQGPATRDLAQAVVSDRE